MMKTFEKASAEEFAIISSFKENGQHVVRYSNIEWCDVWGDSTTEQILTKKVVFRVVVFAILIRHTRFGFKH